MTLDHLSAFGMVGERDWRWTIAWESRDLDDLLDGFDDTEIEELCAMRERMLRLMNDRAVRSYLASPPLERLRAEARWAEHEAQQAEEDLDLLEMAA